MKPLVTWIALLMLLCISINVQAQKFYLRAGAGMTAEFGKTEFNNADPNGLTMIQQSTSIVISADGSMATVEALNGTLGGGYKFNLTPGYMINKYLGVELGVTYFKGDKVTIGELYSPVIQSKESAYLEGVDVSPALFINPALDKLNPYARLGLIVPVGGQLNIETSVRQINGGGDGTDIMVAASSEVKSQFSLGYFGALGVTYPVSPKIQVFGELGFTNLSIKSKTAKIVKYTTKAVTGGQSVDVPGQQLADLQVSFKSFVFKDNYTVNTTTSTALPKEIPSQYVNASGMGISIGVTISL